MNLLLLFLFIGHERAERNRWAAGEGVGEWEKYNSRRNEPDERLIGANNL